jgi:hypothetical protein
MENQSSLLNPGFIKLFLNFVSLATCFLTFYNTTDAATFTSSSILFMANNILTCIELPPAKISKKIGKIFVRAEFVIGGSLFFFGSLLNTANDNTLAIFKWLIGLFMVAGFILVAYIKGQKDTQQDVEARKIAQKIVRKANDEFHNDMCERKKHYANKSLKYIAGTSYKKSGRKK